MAEDTRKIVVAYDPNDLTRIGKTETVSVDEARQLVHDGRAQYADEKPASKADKAS